MGVIYKITSPSGRVYVGKTINLKRRISDYRFKLNKRSSIIINSIKKYGWINHKLEVIEEDVLEENLDEREMFWISELKTYFYHNKFGMNQTLGGDGQRTTWMHDTERRKKQTDRLTGTGNPFFGKHHSEEFKAKKSKEVSEYNKKIGWKVPEWGAAKGRLKIIRAVVCYDVDGNFVQEFVSGTEASNKLNVHRSSVMDSCVNRITGVEGKYVFRYKTENYPLKIEIGEIKKKDEKKEVICIYKNKRTEFEGPEEAAKKTGIPITTIRRAAAYRNGKPIRTGHIFHYKNKN